jgi:hypothetical protein
MADPRLEPFDDYTAGCIIRGTGVVVSDVFAGIGVVV